MATDTNFFELLKPGDWRRFAPFLAWWDRVDRKTLRADFFAGMTNAAVVLPQGVAFAAIAGLPPEYGLYTAMITPIVAALFGSSMIMVSGPTTAISAVVFAALQPNFAPESPEFITAALMLTFLVGVIQLMLGAAQLGRLAAFVSHSVMVGFTAAAAVLIGVSQIRGALGVDAERGGSVLERLLAVWRASSDGVEWRAVLIAAVTIAVTYASQRIDKRLPAFLIALTAGTLLSLGIGAEGLAKVGALPSILPNFSPVFPTAEQASSLGGSAVAIALIGLLEAVAIGRAFAPRTNAPFSANQEIIGQGMSNVVGSMFQAYPGSGSFTRSGLNYEAGAKTPLSAIFAAVGLFLILLAIAPLVRHIPIAAMSGLIIVVAIRLVDVGEVKHIVTSSRTETFILASTFLIGVLIELELSIFVGFILSLAAFIHRTMRPNFVIVAPDAQAERRRFRNAESIGLDECPQMILARFDGPLYFGSSEYLEGEFRRIATERPLQKILVMNLKTAGDIDLAGVDVLVKEAKRRRAIGGDLYVIARSEPFVNRLKRLGLHAALGEDHILPDKYSGPAKLVPTLDQEICAGCKVRIFMECPPPPEPDSEKAQPGKSG